MILNPDKLQAMIMGCYKKENKHDLNKNNSMILLHFQTLKSTTN